LNISSRQARWCTDKRTLVKELAKGTDVKKDLPPHHTQPIFRDKHEAIRFRGNAIVRCLLDRDGGDLEGLAKTDMSGDRREIYAKYHGERSDGSSAPGGTSCST
jgi:hypothetical protein